MSLVSIYCPRLPKELVCLLLIPMIECSLDGQLVSLNGGQLTMFSRFSSEKSSLFIFRYSGSRKGFDGRLSSENNNGLPVPHPDPVALTEVKAGWNDVRSWFNGTAESFSIP